jgi:hypothetical protein
MNTFDAPEREFCMARRSRTNTPLQALVLLNDPTFLEASRKLAERALREGGSTDNERLAFAFRLAFSRKPSSVETNVLLKTLDQRRMRFRDNSADAKSFITVGESPRDDSLSDSELAAWASVMSLILNLDEAITKG